MTPPNQVGLVELAATLCAPPGSGWATSRSGFAPLAANLHLEHFGSTEPVVVRDGWRSAMQNQGSSDVAVVGVPFDGGSYGSSATAGGPLGVRLALTAGSAPTGSWLDLGDVPYYPVAALDEMLAPSTLRSARAYRFGDPSAQQPVCPLSIHLALAAAARADGVRLASIGGDHSITASAVLGLGAPGLGLVHMDAHPDLSDGRDGIELLHNTWIDYIDARAPLARVVQVGCAEPNVPSRMKGRLERVGAEELAGNPDRVAVLVATGLIERGVDHAYLTVDVDVMDRADAPATGLPATSPVRLRHIVRFIEALGEELRIIGADVVEISPGLSGQPDWAEERTCRSGAHVLRSLIAAMGRNVHG